MSDPSKALKMPPDMLLGEIDAFSGYLPNGVPLKSNQTPKDLQSHFVDINLIRKLSKNSSANTDELNAYLESYQSLQQLQPLASRRADNNPTHTFGKGTARLNCTNEVLLDTQMEQKDSGRVVSRF